MTSISSASPAFTGRDPDNRLFGPLPDVSGRPATTRSHPERVGFFTDTSVCIGCKACEVACKEWNTLPMDDSHGMRDAMGLSGMSYDNTGQLGANSWRHVAFIEQCAPSTCRCRPSAGPATTGRASGPVAGELRRPRQPGARAGQRAQRRGAERVRPADRAERHRQAGALADELRRLQALHARRLPRRLPDRGAVPHRVRHRRRAGRHLQRLRLLRAPPAPTASSTSARTTAGSSSARCATTG